MPFIHQLAVDCSWTSSHHFNQSPHSQTNPWPSPISTFLFLTITSHNAFLLPQLVMLLFPPSPSTTLHLNPNPPPFHSSVNSTHSSASRSSGGGGSVGIGGGSVGGSQPHSPISSYSSSCRSSFPHQPLQPGGIAAHRLSSVSSHDSGFVSQDANIYSKPPSPMPSDITSQVQMPYTHWHRHWHTLLCW